MDRLNFGQQEETPPEDLPPIFKYEQVLEEKTDKHVFKFFRALVHWGFFLFVLLHGEPDLLDIAIKTLNKLGGE